MKIKKIFISILLITILFLTTLNIKVKADEFYTDYSEYEKDLLYRIVYAEAGNCSDLTQQIVTQVILNRWMSYHFPTAIHEVIFQPNQFSPAPWIYSYPIDTRVVQNVDKVLYEITPCPYNVLFFKTTWCEVYFPWDLYLVIDGVEFYSVGY